MTLLFLFPPSLVTFLLVIFFYPLLTYIIRQSKPSKLPPGTLGWCPFLGQTLSFLTPHVSTSRGHFLESNIQRYGKIFKSHLFGHPTIVSCDADFNSFILHNEDRFFTSSYPTNIPGILGDLTLLVTTGDVHKRLRAVALNLFATIKTENSCFLSDIENNAIQILGTWKNKRTLIFCEESRKFTFSVIVKQILSLGPEDHETALILDNFTTFMKGLASLPINLPGTPYAKAIHAKHQIKAITKTILQKRKEREGREDERRMDFLDVLLTHNNTSEEEILSLVLDLLLGGYETTAMLISIIVKFLSGCPRALNELREEHEGVRRGKVGDGGLGWDDYKCMNFTQDLINEALRCGNVVKFVHRKAITPIQYKGFEIPVGWKVLPIFSGVHLDSSHYSDPQQFNPWRWQVYVTNEQVRWQINITVGPTRFSMEEKMGEMGAGGKNFTPFGGGRRLCPGSDLAKLETAFFLHHLVLDFSWDPLIDDDQPISFPYLDFKHGLPISIHPFCQPH